MPTLNKKTLVKVAVALAALALVIRFRTQIAAQLAKIPVVNKVAGLA